MRRVLNLAAILFPLAFAGLASQAADPAIPRKIPPPGIAVDAAERQRLAVSLAALAERIAAARQSEHFVRIEPLLADVEVLYEAVLDAVELDEFYRPEDVTGAGQLIDEADARLDRLLAGEAPWASRPGLVVRGFRSRIDGSVQPYGLVIADDVDFSRAVPLYVWLHGRGEQSTNLRFMLDRSTNAGTIQPRGAIVLHPFGRYCNAFKFAGETDVFEAIEAVQRHYRIDPDRIVLWGFSMGGAGAWHLGAHYPDRWAVVSPGAGFAETSDFQKAFFNNYEVDQAPPYEKTLWGLYDVPPYVRNLFHVPVFAYSGERDKQIQAARVMETAYALEGHTLLHLVGPDTEHSYHPEVLTELGRLVADAAAPGLRRFPPDVTLQTRTLRYSRAWWVEAVMLGRHWEDARIDASLVREDQIRVTTRNVTALALYPARPGMTGYEQGCTVEIDGQTIVVPRQTAPRPVLYFERTAGGWELYGSRLIPSGSLRKLPKLQGPIDDAFYDPFLVVLPSGKCAHPAVEQWVQAELAHFRDRWRRLMRGELRVKRDDEVTFEDMLNYHLVLWGDPQSNRLIARVAPSLPIRWETERVVVGDREYLAEGHVPLLIYPNPLQQRPSKYVVLNSGLTFREYDDRSNALQTPKLPDWAVIDLSQAPDDHTPGRVAAAGFFDEGWRLE